MKHTQGKWEIKENGTEFESTIYSEGVRIAEVKSFGNGNGMFNDATVEERIANAKLIAAAPELLEVLKHVLVDIDFKFHPNLQDKCINAINNATL